jgi:hypothetical protein
LTKQLAKPEEYCQFVEPPAKQNQSKQLNFKRRIEREDWIRQAKELSGIS